VKRELKCDEKGGKSEKQTTLDKTKKEQTLDKEKNF
jgi:hypothetical protein